eukprot:TRINITY_DN107214_c0_g1_i1.p1 TRINITY_DN107214_c0_g1~~TRINITY_DN107214_c0_g1_i1.p1  ORF type:complete len:494 (-),score=116.35 TRINITY_DN107214_c0_g1_i1:60-1490(-)
MGNSGLLTCCTNDVRVDNTDVRSTNAPQRKIRPLLCDLEDQFRAHAGEDQLLDEKELTEIWKKAAMKKVGKLVKEDEALIEQSTKEYFRMLDIDRSGKITFAEFASGLMGGTEATPHSQEMRTALNKKTKEDPQMLEKLVKDFQHWDKNGDGFVTPDELKEHLAELNDLAKKDGVVDAGEAAQIAKVEKLCEEMFHHADVDGDGKIDLWEVMAYLLGRKKQPVELLLYDISGGMAKSLGPMLLGKQFEAVHSGVMMYGGSEYWYGGKVFRSDAPCRKQFGEPLTEPWGLKLEQSEQKPELPCIRLGYTFVTHDEFVNWLKVKVTPRYSGLETYDLLTHSCNHFSNEVCTFLLGHGIPERIFELQKTFLSGPVVAIRPFLNRALGGFADAEKELDENFMAKDQDVDGDASHVKESLLGTGDVVMIEGLDGVDGCVLATVIKEEDGKCSVKFFHPSENTIKTMDGVPKSKIKKTGGSS